MPNEESLILSKVVHIALEYGTATLGGLGSVTTQMLSAQNNFLNNGQNVFDASIITPYYPAMYKYESLQIVAMIQHLYNDTIVKSIIYLHENDRNKHFLIAPTRTYKNLFDIANPNEIYNNTETSLFLDRVKYFNSAAAAYLNNCVGIKHPNANIAILHDWQASLVPKLLTDVHKNYKIKSIFIAHVSNIDFGGYDGEALQGIGLKFSSDMHMLKAIGLNAAHKIVAVSPSFLKTCTTEKCTDRDLEYLRKIFVIATIKSKVAGILNGFNYRQFCPLGTLINDSSNIIKSKLRIKQQLSEQFSKYSYSAAFNPHLPVIFFVGRFSPEKGVETFQQLVNIIKDRAVFLAIGRGLTESMFTLMQNQSKYRNVFISNDEDVQKKYGAMMRACADWTYIPSHREACGLVPMEGFANGAPCITSGVGGLQDLVVPIQTDVQGNSTGNGFKYKDRDDGVENPALTHAVNKALTFWGERTLAQKNIMHLRIMREAESLDWLAKDGALSKYHKICDELQSKKVRLIAG